MTDATPRAATKRITRPVPEDFFTHRPGAQGVDNSLSTLRVLTIPEGAAGVWDFSNTVKDLTNQVGELKEALYL